MEAQELQRIYLLKTSGLAGVLSDINAITDAFTKSAEAKAELSGNKGMFDTAQLATVNKQLEQMLNIQGEMLSAMKGLTTEFSKTAPALENIGKGATTAADGLADLSGSAKSLGGNLSSVAPALLKVQSTLNTGKIEDYDAAINKLVADLVVYQQMKAESKASFEGGKTSFSDKDFLTGLKERGYPSNTNIKDDKVLIGHSEVASLTEEYLKQREAVADIVITTEQYKKEQLELDAAIRQLEAAIRTLNNTNNPALPIENAQAYKMQAAEMLLTAKASDELLQKQIELDAMQGEINAKRKQAAYFVSGKAAEDEAALLQKQILFGEAYVADLDKQNAKLEERARLIRANQELKGEAYASTIQTDLDKQNAKEQAAWPRNKAIRKEDLEDERQEVELLKNRSRLADEATSAYMKWTAELNILSITLHRVTKEEDLNSAETQKMIARANVLKTKIREFDMAMGNTKTNIGNYGLNIKGVGDVVTMFTRQLARGVGSLIIWGLLFDALSKTKDVIAESIPGTDAYIEKQEKLAQATESLKATFISIGQVIDEYNQKVAKAEHEEFSPIFKSVDDLRLEEAAIKAKGVTALQVYNADIAQHEQSNKRRVEEISNLNKQIDLYKGLQTAMETMQRSAATMTGKQMVEHIQSFLPHSEGIDELTGKPYKHLDVPAAFMAKIQADLAKSIKDAGGDAGGRLSAVGNALLEYSAKIDELKGARAKVKGEGTDEEVAFQAKVNNLVYAKDLELKNSLVDLWDTYRQLKHAKDGESIDKGVDDIETKYSIAIKDATDKYAKAVGDAEAKYAIIVQKTQQSAVQYAKTVLGDKDFNFNAANYKNKDGSENFAEMYKNLPDWITKGYGAQLGVAGSINKQTENNAQFDLMVQEYAARGRQILAQGQETINQRGFKSTVLGEDATNAKTQSAFGVTSLTKLTTALDKETEAKKAALQIQHDNQVKYIDDNFHNQQEWATQQKALEARTAEDISIIDNEAYKKRLWLGFAYFNAATEMIESHSQRLIMEMDTYNTDRSTKVLNSRFMTKAAKDRRVTKIDNQKIIAQAKEEIRTRQVELNNLGPDVINAEGEYQAAGITKNVDKETEARRALAAVLDKEVKLRNDIANANHRIAQAKLDKDDVLGMVKNQLIDVAQQAADAYMQLLAEQDAYKQEMAKRSLEWNQKVMDSEVRSNNQKLTEQKATMLAERQLNKQKMQDDHKRAEAQLIISYVIGLAKDWELGWPAGAIAAAGQTIGLGIAEAALSRAPAYAQGTGSGTHPGGLAWVGDGGEHEIIISPKTPTLMNLPKGSQVIPMSQAGNLGVGLTAPRFSTTSSFGGSSSSNNNVDHTAAFAEIHASLHTIAKGMANINVNYDARKAGKAGLTASFKSRRI